MLCVGAVCGVCECCVWSVGVLCVCGECCVWVKALFVPPFSLNGCNTHTHTHTHTQVGDIAQAVASMISDSTTAGKTYELAG